MPRAPRRCPGRKGACTNLITSTRYCPECTVSWRGPRTNSSKVTTTSAWQKAQRDYLKRHTQCKIQYPGICTGRATTVDKIKPAARRPDLALDQENWQAACRPCNEHKARTEDRDAGTRRR